MRHTFELLVAPLILLANAVAAGAADTRPQPGSEIAVDRPDVTNSSLVVPKGSFQQENGVNIAGRDGGQVLDGTNTRLRQGVAVSGVRLSQAANRLQLEMWLRCVCALSLRATMSSIMR
jgi:hypothetical protein